MPGNMVVPPKTTNNKFNKSYIMLKKTFKI
jgi:hypothetical protein